MSSAGVYPDVGHDVMQPPRQFDSYYYHPSTLNHSQTSVPLYSGPYRQRPAAVNGLQASASAGNTRSLAVKKASVGQYGDSPARPGSINGRPLSSHTPSNSAASTEYAVLKFNAANEINV
jgi:hypothetical protein